MAGRGDGANLDAWQRLFVLDGRDDELVNGYLLPSDPYPFGVESLDKSLGGGLRPGLNVLMADPGAGKTALAVQLLAHNAMAGRECLYVTLEMPVSQIRGRVRSYVSTVPNVWDDTGEETVRMVPWRGGEEIAEASWRRVMANPVAAYQAIGPGWAGLLARSIDRSLSAAEPDRGTYRAARRGLSTGDPEVTAIELAMRSVGDRMAEATDRARDLVLGHPGGAVLDAGPRRMVGRMAVTDVPSHYVEDVCGLIDSVTEALGHAPLVAVDYLQYMQSARCGPESGEVDVTKQVADQLTACALRNGCCILCVCAKRKQSRGEEQGGMWSVRGSSSVVYDAQAVMGLSPVDGPHAFWAMDPNWRGVEFHVSKNRSGPLGDDRQVWFNGRFNVFRDREEDMFVEDGGGDGC